MKTKIVTIAVAGLVCIGMVNSANAKMLRDGQVVVASFDSGRLKGKTFRLRYNESSGLLGDRKVTSHTNGSLAIKTPGGWCKFSSTGVATCHNGKGKWKAR